MINLELFPCSGGMAEGFRRAGVTFDLAIEIERATIRAQGLCVNGPNHGKSVRGGRCWKCWEAKKASERRRA